MHIYKCTIQTLYHPVFVIVFFFVIGVFISSWYTCLFGNFINTCELMTANSFCETKVHERRLLCADFFVWCLFHSRCVCGTKRYLIHAASRFSILETWSNVKRVRPASKIYPPMESQTSSRRGKNEFQLFVSRWNVILALLVGSFFLCVLFGTVDFAQKEFTN